MILFTIVSLFSLFSLVKNNESTCWAINPTKGYFLTASLDIYPGTYLLKVINMSYCITNLYLPTKKYDY